jgi:hypothetical protein
MLANNAATMNAAKVSNCEVVSGRPEGCRENERMFAATPHPSLLRAHFCKRVTSRKSCVIINRQQVIVRSSLPHLTVVASRLVKETGT